MRVGWGGGLVAERMGEGWGEREENYTCLRGTFMEEG